ncbi:MAG: ABC transporter substrate-binding protein [Trueperaceae bacterium]|nr:ABC transporter substrate-binding protein [Trueperaceae bacterium]
MKLRTVVGSLLACLAIALTGVGLAQTAGGSVVIAINAEPDSLDPQKSATAVVNQVMRYIGDTLVNKDLDGNYIPGLATSWAPSADDTVWTFTLREGVTFHNGRPVNAEAVRASFLRAKDPATQSAVAAGLLAPVDDVVAVGEYTLEFHLARPYYLLIENLTQQALAVIDAQAAAELGADFNRRPVLTGPWKVGPWASGSQITLERNPDYAWGPEYAHDGAAYLDTIVFQVIPDQATATAAFLAGNVDLLTVAPSDVEQLSDAGGYTMLSFMRKGLGLYMAYNVNKAPFDDPLVRRAMAYLIDKDALVAVSLRGLGQPACGPLPPSILGYWDGICDYAAPYDPARGLEILAEAGYTQQGGKLVKDGQPLAFSIITSSTYGWPQSAQVVQAMLKELGITVDVELVEHTTLLAQGREGAHQAIFLGYTYTSADILNSYLNSANIGTGYNWAHYADPEIDSRLALTRGTSDDALRAETYAELQRMVLDLGLWLPLWINDNYIALQPRVEGAQLSKEGFVALLDASVK